MQLLLEAFKKCIIIIIVDQKLKDLRQKMELNQIDFENQQVHLQNVSRTFALTIPMLPKSLIDYISNAYLLCRIADTVEDDPLALKEKKITWLKSFAVFCSNQFADEMELLRLHKIGLELVEKGAKDTELLLMKDMEPVIKRTMGFPPRVKSILAKGVAILSYGMAASLEGQNIKNLDDVDRYCYFVAGVVGELLAALFSEHNKSIDKKGLMILAVSFGEGLQLTNILKDRITDNKRNVSFLPTADKDTNSSQIIKDYIAICQGHLDDALDFIVKLPENESGIRLFCLLNIAMATATIKLISSVDTEKQENIKISRNKVILLYVLSKMCAKSNFMTKLLFSFLSRGVKRQRRNPLELHNKVSCWEHDLNIFSIQEGSGND